MLRAMNHRITMLVAVAMDVEADSYAEALRIASLAAHEPGAVTIAGAEGYGIRIVGLVPTPPLNLDAQRNPAPNAAAQMDPNVTFGTVRSR